MRIIAEIGVNHNGSTEKARELVRSAFECGCSGVKFQAFKASRLVEKTARKVEYQKRSGYAEETHYEMLKRLELDTEELNELRVYAEGLGLDFLVTPYDPESARDMINIGVTRFKTASADLGDLYLHEELSSIRAGEIIIATGMSELKSIEATISLYKWTKPILLHCVSAYPCPDSEVNAKAIISLKETFPKHEVGYSDHGLGTIAAVIATALGASLIERHFTLDRTDNGPDHFASSDPIEMKQYVDQVMRAQKVLGTGEKKTQLSEREMQNISKKAIKSRRTIKTGEPITLENTYALRPAEKGISVDYLNRVLSTKARVEIAMDSFIQWDMLSEEVDTLHG